MTLKDKEIILGVTGGIACYKSLDIIRGIQEAGGNVTVIMTSSATEFVQPLTFQAISGRPVATSLFSLMEDNKIGHIKLAENANAVLIAPATANILGKAAHGIADDYLSTTLLACKSQLFVAPAMNDNMWQHQAVKRNLEILKKRGVKIIYPESGYLACGSYGTGRMTSPENIVATLENWFESETPQAGKNKPLKNISVVITAGPTQEKIDAVRYLSNFSSGKMGYALAECCQKLGAEVSLISGPTRLASPNNIDVIRVTSAEDMYQAVMEKAEEAQLIIKAAAVSDYRVENPNPQKIKKTAVLALKLIQNPDILKELGNKKTKNQFLVGFAAESQNLLESALHKLRKKNLDLIVANNILDSNAGFGVDTNKVFLLDHLNQIELPLLSKMEVAEKILKHILASEKWQSISNITAR